MVRLANLVIAMNARMRRIDLACKLLGPLVISLIALASTAVAVWTTLVMNLASVIVEYVAIEQVNWELPCIPPESNPRQLTQ